jgi:hypothetical protein
VYAQVKHVYDGYNVCVLAYGGAGTGKTHTLHGSTTGGSEGTGVINSAVLELFKHLRGGTRNALVTVQMFRVCEDTVVDLLYVHPSAASISPQHHKAPGQHH